jgi:hypothetical protein
LHCRLRGTPRRARPLHFEEGVDLVFNQVINFRRHQYAEKFSSRLKPGEMHARPRGAALFEGLIIEQPPPAFGR